MIRFGPFLGDLPDLDNPGLTKAEGCLPGARDSEYRPFPTLAAITNALPSRAKGGMGGLSNTGNAFSFAGDNTKLYQQSGNTWNDVSRLSGGPYTTAADGFWEPGIFRNEMIFTNLADEPQIFTMGSSSNFKDMGTNTPKARHFAVWGDWPVLAHTSDATDGLIVSRVWWGPRGNPDGDWTPNPVTQAGRRTLEQAHEVMGLVSGERGLVLTKKSHYIATFVGGDAIWQLDPTIKDKGCVASGSIASDRRRIFFLAEDGWYALGADGIEIVNIGHDRFDKFFLRDAKADSYRYMRAGIIPDKTLLMVAYVGQGASGTVPNRVMSYDWEEQNVTFTDENVEVFVNTLTPFQTLEQIGAQFASLEDVTPSFDDRYWAGGAVINGAFDDQHCFGTFSGPAAEAILETGERYADQGTGARSFVAGVRPHTDAANVNVRLGARGLESPREQAINWTNYEPIVARTGMAPFRSDAWFHRVGVQIPAGQDWKCAQGFDLDAEGSGGA